MSTADSAVFLMASHCKLIVSPANLNVLVPVNPPVAVTPAVTTAAGAVTEPLKEILVTFPRGTLVKVTTPELLVPEVYPENVPL